jgi:aryl-alcohol dehydrogenase-like predicted oxidoreductase
MHHKHLGQSELKVSAIGLGHSMGANDFSASGKTEFTKLIRRALELGVNFFDSSDAYWNGLHEQWLGAALGQDRGQAIVTSKFGNITLPDGSKATNARPDNVIRCCEASLARLGTDCIDLYYLHRVDPQTPIEDTVGAMARLVQQGKVRYLGLCEAGVATLERAHRVHPITALQTEYSLWSRDAEDEIIPACRRLGIAYVGYSPLGRGLLTGGIQKLEDLAPTDRRRIHPRFHGENLARNLELVSQLQAMAEGLGLTSAQLALAWVMAQGEDIVPIAGTQRIPYLEKNVEAAHYVLGSVECARLAEIFSRGRRAGERYPVEMLPGLGI